MTSQPLENISHAVSQGIDVDEENVLSILNNMKYTAPSQMIKTYAKFMRGDKVKVPSNQVFNVGHIVRVIVEDTFECIALSRTGLNTPIVTMDRWVGSRDTRPEVTELRRRVVRFMDAHLSTHIIESLSRNYYSEPRAYLCVSHRGTPSVIVNQCVSTRVRWMQLPEVMLNMNFKLCGEDLDLVEEEVDWVHVTNLNHFLSRLYNEISSDSELNSIPIAAFYLADAVESAEVPELGEPTGIMAKAHEFIKTFWYTS